jgi:hypothetical protein
LSGLAIAPSGGHDNLGEKLTADAVPEFKLTARAVPKFADHEVGCSGERRQCRTGMGPDSSRCKVERLDDARIRELGLVV